MRWFGGRVHGQRRLTFAVRDADAQSRRFIRRLEDAVLELEIRGPRFFEQVARKTEHVEELRRALGALLDILADWEATAGPAG